MKAMNTATASRPRPHTRRALATCGAVGVLLVATWVGDSLYASATERSLSLALERASRLETAPRVSIGGPGFSLAAGRDLFPTVNVDASDLVIPGYETTSFHAIATKVKISREDLAAGRFDGVEAATLATSIQLNPVIVGQKLNMPDLDIRRASNVSPNGGRESDAILTSDIAGVGTVSVAVHLRIVNTTVQLQPYDVLKGPETDGGDVIKGKKMGQDRRQELMSYFELSIPASEIPLRHAPTYVFCEGGNITVESSARNVTLQSQDFIPAHYAVGHD